MFHEGWSAEVDDYAIVCGWALGGKLFIVGDVGGGLYGVEGDTGKIIWSTRVGRGGKLGGIHFGMATNDNLLFASNSDFAKISASFWLSKE